MHEPQYRNKLFVIVGFVVLAVGISNVPLATAQEQVVLTSGKLEYQQYCTSCHGKDGKGGGPMADLWKNPPADLTQLSKKNKGQFPFWRVYRTIDGREEVVAHGLRAMPIWGSRFLMEEGGSPLDEHTVLGRILALVYYVESLQQK
jgi:mono/diheme cytochrome c family protein